MSMYDDSYIAICDRELNTWVNVNLGTLFGIHTLVNEFIERLHEYIKPDGYKDSILYCCTKPDFAKYNPGEDIQYRVLFGESVKDLLPAECSHFDDELYCSEIRYRSLDDYLIVAFVREDKVEELGFSHIAFIA